VHVEWARLRELALVVRLVRGARACWAILVQAVVRQRPVHTGLDVASAALVAVHEQVAPQSFAGHCQIGLQGRRFEDWRPVNGLVGGCHAVEGFAEVAAPVHLQWRWSERDHCFRLRTEASQARLGAIAPHVHVKPQECLRSGQSDVGKTESRIRAGHRRRLAGLLPKSAQA